VVIRVWKLFQVCQDWYDENKEMAIRDRMFGIRMKDLGMVQNQTSEARFWQDIAIQAQLRRAPIRLKPSRFYHILRHLFSLRRVAIV
jgi:hypothetical protein